MCTSYFDPSIKVKIVLYMADAYEDDKTNCQLHTLVIHTSYYCCKVRTGAIHSCISWHNVKIHNLEP